MTIKNTPALFLAHGSPMNALADNAFTRDLSLFASRIPRPDAIVVVSEHWLTEGTYITGSMKPKRIMTFTGSPRNCTALYMRRQVLPTLPNM